MTQLLLRLFIKNPEETQDTKTRTAIGSLSGIVGILCNLLLFTMKLLVGTLAASVSITADAMNKLFTDAGLITQTTSVLESPYLVKKGITFKHEDFSAGNYYVIYGYMADLSIDLPDITLPGVTEKP